MEIHVHLNGFIYWQTTLGFEWSDVILEKPPQSVLIQCRQDEYCNLIYCDRISVLTFIYCKDRNPITINQVRCRGNIIDPLITDLRRFCCVRILVFCSQWFLKGGKRHALFASSEFSPPFGSRGTEFPYTSYTTWCLHRECSRKPFSENHRLLSRNYKKKLSDL